MKKSNHNRYHLERRISALFMRVVIPGLLVLAISGTGKGQSLLPDSLQAYLELAAKNNPAVKAKFNEYLAEMQKAPQAGGLPDPEFSFGVFIKPMELLGGNQVADFQLMQMFPWFGSLRSARDEASLMAKAKFEAFRDMKQEVFFNVRKAWLELYLNEAQIRVVGENLELLKAIERIAVTRFSASIPGSGESGSNPLSMQESSGGRPGTGTEGMAGGMQGMQTGGQGTSPAGSNAAAMSGGMAGGMNEMGSKSDLISLYRIQIEMGDLENRLAEWRSQKDVLTATMNSLLNRRPDMPVFLPDTLLQRLPVGSYAAIRDSIWTNNTMLTMLSAEKETFDERIRMSKRMSYPMFGVGIDYMLINPREGNTYMMNGKDMFMPMGKITLPIYRGKYSAQRKEAELLSMATVNQISAMQNSLSVDYQNVIKRQSDAARRIQLYRRQSELAQKTLNLMIVEFSVSGTGLDELLKMEQQLLEYGLQKISAIVENNIALASLDRMMANAGTTQAE